MKQQGTYLVYTPTPCLDERMKHSGAPVAGDPPADITRIKDVRLEMKAGAIVLRH